jgi:sugar lactone lactonase YvrE
MKKLLYLGAALLAMSAEAAGFKVLNADAHFPEGPIWYSGKLYYVEYDRNTVTQWDGKANQVFGSLPGCGPSAVIRIASGEFLVTCYDSGTIGRLSADGKPLPAWDHDEQGHKFVGPNDFAVDLGGGIYFTCSGQPGVAGNSAVFYIAADRTISLAAPDMHNANGIALSRDGGTLYVIETDENRLLRFRVAAPGHLADRRLFLNMDDLTHHVGHIYPDGVKIDSHGLLYVGQNPKEPNAPLAGTIFVVSSDGKLLRSIKLPSPGVPNLTFSPDERTLYVTAVDQLDKSPYHGKVYSVANE